MSNLPLYVTSNGSLELYPNNTPSDFTNILKHPILLDPNLEYEVKLNQYHIPPVQFTLGQNDFIDSSITYNIGYFTYDNTMRKYKPENKYSKELFRLAPGTNLEGLYRQTPLELSNIKPSTDSEVNIIGRPYDLVIRENFFKKLNSSLSLDTSDRKKYSIQKRNLDLLKKHFNEKEGDTDFGVKDNFFGHYHSTLNFVLLNKLDHLTTKKTQKLHLELINNTQPFPYQRSVFMRDTLQDSKKHQRNKRIALANFTNNDIDRLHQWNIPGTVATTSNVKKRSIKKTDLDNNMDEYQNLSDRWFEFAESYRNIHNDNKKRSRKNKQESNIKNSSPDNSVGKASTTTTTSSNTSGDVVTMEDNDINHEAAIINSSVTLKKKKIIKENIATITQEMNLF